MKREIKFRGKRVETGEWLYGDFVHSKDKTRCGILVNDAESYDEYEVNPDTVGQYAGLKDRNKKEIYEDDIMSIKVGSVVRQAYVIYNGDCYYLATADGYLLGELRVGIGAGGEVIGNIHDNSELLK